MPDILIVNDNASFASSDTFSTQDSIEQPRTPLRRRNTVATLTRKVSQRITNKILRGGVQEHALSEKNLKYLNDATDVDPPDHAIHEVQIYDRIYEAIEEECPVFDVEAAREMRLHQSYSAFCQNFTLSGTTRTTRKFDLSMGPEWAGEHPEFPLDETLETNDTLQFPGSHSYPEHITVHPKPRASTVEFPISHPSTDLDASHPVTTVERSPSEWPVTDTPNIEEDFDRISSSFEITPNSNSNYLQPPPHIITPTVWMDMQRIERERKAARRQRLLNPFRSWFMASQPLVGAER
ncbi:hypothetical protein DTO013E5_5012 [Penicillium roqueforti]|uniref:Uncharacterized protein n=1 Tax=Penicillium roqueforti (strain FM164) TaxID=1365484 RepID=W6QDF7_PENRF|nr:uncharacterized protein LCP9604111_5736 [Penicillium roqueforti]CDM34510.1 hypothetical protein PROQFM164_S03g001234 [Penicillium roqueforti FM164]KAF9248027.1 hypothetical protein LCP9604111_5736 [Penicillium roqueforti]KAI1834320.1 hypothetical protein CBS147337_4610 [Penicillium roqueforti]KAI2686152.1 hypothetical protein CBS147355_1639 [Penicillium roqueforti]KAI2692382.1 hypothetical protein LCP963914a_476 [Penicillium roqueforti]